MLKNIHKIRVITLLLVMVAGIASADTTITINNNLIFNGNSKNENLSGKTALKQIINNYHTFPAKSYANSFDEDKFIVTGPKTPFFNSFVKAFAEHRSLTLSPDMVWLSISQAFAKYVEQNADTLRNQLVYHQGRKKIVVVLSKETDLLEKDAKWDKVLDIFADSIASLTKGDIAQVIQADFSTTGKTEMIASQITLMSSMKKYFDFWGIRVSCGIPSVTLEGTTEDWQKVLEKTRALEKYGLSWWTSELEPILQEFVNASAGKTNAKFWQHMVMKKSPKELEYGGCGGGKLTMLDGWFLKFFPYTIEGERTPAKVAVNADMPPEMLKVPFTFQDDVRKKIFNLELWAGFVGIEENRETHALRPKIGWVIVGEDK